MYTALVHLFTFTLCIRIAGCYTCYNADLPIEHGLYVIPNVQNNIETGDHVFATMPPGFSIRLSGIPKAGLGAFAETTIPNGTRLGPYDGKLNKPDDDSENDWVYKFEVSFDNGDIKHEIDARDKSVASWIRYVNCARTIDEENLTVYQLNYEIYYVTNRCIKPGTELLVWYGYDYGKELGLRRNKNDYIDYPEKDTAPNVNDIQDEFRQFGYNCYKFYEANPFYKPGYAALCFLEKNFEVCKYIPCDRNPCSKQFDCNTCSGFCLHYGKYIRKKTSFTHADSSNLCYCRESGRSDCTDSSADYREVCPYME